MTSAGDQKVPEDRKAEVSPGGNEILPKAGSLGNASGCTFQVVNSDVLSDLSFAGC